MWDEAAGFASKIFKNVNGIHDLNGVIPEHQMELTRQLAIEAFANANRNTELAFSLFQPNGDPPAILNALLRSTLETGSFEEARNLILSTEKGSMSKETGGLA